MTVLSETQNPFVGAGVTNTCRSGLSWRASPVGEYRSQNESHTHGRVMSRHTPKPTKTPDLYRDETAYPLSVGQQVYDIRELVTSNASEAGTAVVVDTEPGDVHTTSFTTPDGECKMLSEYGINRLYADFDASTRVVTIRWDSWLDANVPEWRENAGDAQELSAHLRQARSDWSIPVTARGYSYPESRLVPIESL